MHKRIYSNLDELSQARHLVYGLNPLIGWLEETDRDCGEFLEYAEIPRSALSNPDYHITPTQELAFHAIACNKLDIPHLGLIIGPRYHLSSYGMLGLAAQTAENLYECYSRFFEHIIMTWTYFRFGLYVDGDYGILDMVSLRDLGTAHRFMVDRDISAAYTIACEALGMRLPLLELDLRQSESQYRQEYEHIFQCPIKFGAERNALVFEREWLTHTLENSEPATSKVFAAQCKPISDSLRTQYDLTEHIRSLVMNWGDAPKSLDDIARALHTTPRSIQRRLSAEGTSYNELVQEVRMNVAIEYLRTTSLSISEISFHLGFGNSSSFSHAFKKWHGRSPSATRQSAVT